MLKTIRDYISGVGDKSFNELWVDYLISIDSVLHEYEIKSINDRDLTVDNLQRELYEIGKEIMYD